VERDVFVASRRRCCLCVFLDGREDVRRGQIAHLNRDRSDSRSENLVFLCLEHHDEYDTRRSQSKGFSTEEVRAYRDRLYRGNGEVPSTGQIIVMDAPTNLTPLPGANEYEILRQRFRRELDFTSARWRFPMWQVANQPELFAYKAGNGSDGVCLIERIDLPDRRIVVACIEMAGNPGNSITNCVEELCFQVCERFEIPADRLVWLEHYDYIEDSDWSLVDFKRMPPNRPFEDPKWTPMSWKMWRELRLKPRKRLTHRHGNYESELRKLFHWPSEAIL
jgi:hypothetical protein